MRRHLFSRNANLSGSVAVCELPIIPADFSPLLLALARIASATAFQSGKLRVSDLQLGPQKSQSPFDMPGHYLHVAYAVLAHHHSHHAHHRHVASF
jgi:hypothetical protein